MWKRLGFLIFVVIGACVLIWGYGSYNKSQKAKSWPTAEGTIISSDVELARSHASGRRRSRRTYRAEVMFEYNVDGKTYTSNRVVMEGFSSSKRSYAEKVVERYPEGEAVTVYYDPTDPTMAVLEPGKVGGAFIPFVVGGMFVIVGTMGAIRKTT